MVRKRSSLHKASCCWRYRFSYSFWLNFTPIEKRHPPSERKADENKEPAWYPQLKEVMEQSVNIVNNSLPRCPYCHESVEISSSKTACESCMAWHHKECWQEHGGCSACGLRTNTNSTHSQVERTIEVREACSYLACQEPVQVRLTAHSYRVRCLTHALKFSREKIQYQKKVMFFFLFLLILSLPPVVLVNLARPGSESSEEALVNFWVSVPIFIIMVLYSEREGHKRKLKALEELLPEKPEEKGSSGV